MKKSGLQWSFANNSAAAYSQFLSFKSSQEQGGTHKQYPPGFSQVWTFSLYFICFEMGSLATFMLFMFCVSC